MRSVLLHVQLYQQQQQQKWHTKQKWLRAINWPGFRIVRLKSSNRSAPDAFVVAGCIAHTHN